MPFRYIAYVRKSYPVGPSFSRYLSNQGEEGREGKAGKVRKIEKKILPDSSYLPHLPHLPHLPYLSTQLLSKFAPASRQPSDQRGLFPPTFHPLVLTLIDNGCLRKVELKESGYPGWHGW